LTNWFSRLDPDFVKLHLRPHRFEGRGNLHAAFPFIEGDSTTIIWLPSHLQEKQIAWSQGIGI